MNVMRKEQSDLEFSRLKNEVNVWHCKRVNADKFQQYKTQLDTLKKLLDDAVGFLESQLSLVAVDQAVGELYEKCELFDLRVLWLRKLWNFYREKFDQRDDDKLKNVLLAADEVVWSCFHQVFINEDTKRPAPLPFIEESYSPESFPSELVPYGLKPSENGFLQDLINRLPIPLISVPQSCVQFPWHLVYIGHETGHQIQYALADNLRLVRAFQNRISEIIWEKTKDEDYAEKWSYWGREIFADVFSVMVMGNWAVWAMVDFETKEHEVMLKRRSQYPSPVVRLSLLKTIAEKLGLNGSAAVRDLDLEKIAQNNSEAKRDLSFVESIVDMSLGDLPVNGKKLTTLADFRLEEFQSGGLVENLATDLKNGSVNMTGDLRKARFLVCAALANWAETISKDKRTRAAVRENLSVNMIDSIINNRPEGARNAEPETAAKQVSGRDLSDLLLNVHKNELKI